MNEIIISILLGIIEGFTEFLPISSTGHLIIANNFLGFTGEFAKTFDIIIQLGAIFAVIIYFRKRLFPFGKYKSQENKKESQNIWKKTIIGVIPAIFIGASIGKYIKDLLFNPITVAIALLLGGFILIIIENKKRKIKISSLELLSYKSAFIIGLIQCLAFIPGVSRSAATIIGAMLLGSSRLVAAEFSFYLAIPTMIAASVYTLLDKLIFTNKEMLLLIIGFTVSFLVAWIVIAEFMNYISNKDFKVFGYYRIILGIVVLIYFKMLV